MVEDGEQVAHGHLGPGAVGTVGGEPVPPVVPRDHGPVPGERGDLLVPGGVIAARPMTQDERNTTLSDYLVVQDLTVVLDEAGSADEGRGSDVGGPGHTTEIQSRPYLGCRLLFEK